MSLFIIGSWSFLQTSEKSILHQLKDADKICLDKGYERFHDSQISCPKKVIIKKYFTLTTSNTSLMSWFLKNHFTAVMLTENSQLYPNNLGRVFSNREQPEVVDLSLEADTALLNEAIPEQCFS